MRFLADESCDSIIIKTLREVGHDVLAVGEITPRAGDSEVIRLARREKRVLLTEDKGAETLLGRGELLFKDFGPASRLQSSLISDRDLKAAARC